MRRSIASVIPPCTIGECPQVDLVRPRGSVLLHEVDVRLRDLRGKHEAVMLFAPGFSQLFEPFRSQRFPKVSGASTAPSITMCTTWIPLDANSALRVWQSMRRPPIAAACEC